MKKITAFILVLVMLLPLCLGACGDDKPTPGPLPVDTNPADTNGDNPSSPDDTQPEEDLPYEPDPDALYAGSFGIGANCANVSFDSVRIKNLATKKSMIEIDNASENPMSTFKFATAVGGNWTPSADDFAVTTYEELDTKGEVKDSYPVITLDKTDASGVMAYFGEPEWNFMQFALKMKVDDLGDGVVMYFCITDENNYYSCVIGEENNSRVTVYKVTNGTSEIVERMPYKLPLGTWFTASVSTNRRDIAIYIAGTLLFDLYREADSGDVYWGGVGLGSWSTAQSWDNLKITSNVDGSVIYENDFEDASSLERDFVPRCYSAGTWPEADMAIWTEYWQIVDDESDGDHGKVLSLNTDAFSGCVAMIGESIGNSEWTNYTIDVDVRRDAGAEAWLVFFNTVDESNYVMWNIGGWANTKSAFEYIVGGQKSTGTQIDDKYDMGAWYHVTLMVKQTIVYAYVDNELKQVFTI